MKIPDGERIRLRKVTEEEWLAAWRGKLSTPAARLDLMRRYHRRQLIDLEVFRAWKKHYFDD